MCVMQMPCSDPVLTTLLLISCRCVPSPQSNSHDPPGTCIPIDGQLDTNVGAWAIWNTAMG